jgi:putative spermidine/putrescine transport system permease protein
MNETAKKAGRGRRASAFVFRHPRLKLGLTLSPTLVWMMAIYLVSLALLLVTSFWRLNELSGEVERVWGLQNYQKLFTSSIYWVITLRTLLMALAVTLTDLCLAFPIAYFAARVAKPRARSAILLLVVIPLWANYLVRVFAWKTAFAGGGPVEALFGVLGMDVRLAASNFAVWVTLSYLWLPYTILPIYASLERVPGSLLEASADLGARNGRTFRKVVFPLALPGIVAASIFSFSLSLGDYLTPTLVGKSLFIGNAIDQLVGTAQNRPLAAAIATIPIAIIALYLLIARAFGAFEAL